MYMNLQNTNVSQSTKKVTITGITGQDGYNMASYLIEKHLCFEDSLKNKEYIIYGCYLNPDKIVKNDQLFSSINLVKLDLTNFQDIENHFKEVCPDYFINFASAQPQYVKDNLKMFQTNTISSIYILECILKYNSKCRYLSAGSCLEYDLSESQTINLDTIPHPTTIYGISKLTNRYLTEYYRNTYNLFSVHVIFFNHDSSRRTDDFILKKIVTHMKKIKSNEISPMIFCENINVSKDWSDSRDFMEAIWLMLEYNKAETYILSSNKLNSLIDFINLVCKYLNMDVTWRYNESKFMCLYYNDNIILTGKYQQKNPLIIGCNEKVINMLQWNQKISFEKMIYDMIYL